MRWVLLALGAMDPYTMAFFAAVIVAERLAPAQVRVAQGGRDARWRGRTCREATPGG